MLSVLAAVSALAFAPAAQAAPTWVTLGEQAYVLLLQEAAKAPATATATRILSSRRVPVTVPQLRGSPVMVQGSETVLAVEVEEDLLDGLSQAVHEQLHRCGGYARHDSEAEALAVLHRVSRAGQGGEALRLPSYAIDNPAAVNARLPLIQGSNLLSTITQLSNFQNRRHNSSHGEAASNWLFNQWNSLNPGNRRDVRVSQITHSYVGLPTRQKSVEFSIVGSGNSGETLIIGAHLDSINGGSATAETQRAPGADDDASGVATLTELIRVLMATNFQPQRNIRFIAYAAEEVGLRGSQAIAAAQAGRRDRVVGVLQLDMTAFIGDNTDIWIYTDYTNAQQNQFLANLVSTYLPTLSVGYDRCGYGCSDHAAWHNAGFPASFPHEASNATFNRALHTVNDTTATFGNQAEHALKFARLAMAYVVELASDATPARPVDATATAAPLAHAAGAARR
jgi:leucyl aminopeptidase